MNRVTVAPAARSDLRKIWFYTAENWSAGQADRYVSSIVAAFDRLGSGESEGRSADQFRRGYYRLAVGSHFVFYKPTSSGDINVVRVLHQRMNLPDRLRNH